MKEYFVWLAKFLTTLLVLVVLAPMLLMVTLTAAAKLAEGTRKVDVVDKSKRVAVIELSGIISDSKKVLRDLHRHAANDRVQGIVLRVNSPGGAVAPSQEIYQAVSRLKERKPIVASLGLVAASGGLYAALGASRVLCQPGTLTGSIGVILEVPNFSKIADQLGVKMVTVKSGDFKDVGNVFRDMTPAERALLQTTVDAVHEDFVQAVIAGRQLDREQVLTFADGRILTGSQALDLNLVDGFGDVYEAARAVFEIKGEPLAEDESPLIIFPREDRLSRVWELLDTLLDLPLRLMGQQRQFLKLQYLMN